MSEEIVVTGFGTILPQISNSAEFSELLQSGRNTLTYVKGYGLTNETIVGGIIEEEYIEIGNRNYKRYPKFSRLAIKATEEALQMAGIAEVDPVRTAVVGGVSVGAVPEVELYSDQIRHGNPKKFPLLAGALANSHSMGLGIGSHLGINGKVFTLNNGCNVAIDGLFMAKLLLESGQVDMCILASGESPFSKGLVYSYIKTKSVFFNTKINEVGLPFSTQSKGFAITDGGGALILERKSTAKKRKAHIFGVIDSVALSNDGISIYQSDKTGEIMKGSMLEVSNGRFPDYVNSQALGLKENDTVEYLNHMQPNWNHIPITSIKGAIGQPFGVTGLFQVISSLLSIQEGFIPPTVRTNAIGYEDLNIVRETKYCEVNSVLVKSHSFGGNNGCVWIRR